MAMSAFLRGSLEALGLSPNKIQIIDHMDIGIGVARAFYNESNGSPTVNRVFSSLEGEFASQGGPGGRYNGLLRTIAREVTEDYDSSTLNNSILDKLERDLRGNPALSDRLTQAIRRDPNGVARMINGYDNGTVTLANGLAQIERGYPAPAGRDAPRDAPRDAQPSNYGERLEREYAAFIAKGDSFVTADERAHVSQLRRTARQNGEVTRNEYNVLHETMDRLDARGQQEIRLRQGPAAPAPAETVVPPTDAPAPAAPAAPAPAETRGPVLPDRITAQDYNDLKDVLVEGIRTSMPELVQNGMLAGFEARLNDPAFQQQFINQYNNDPVFRQRFQGAFGNLMEIGTSAGASGGAGIMGNLIDVEGMRNRLKGQMREFVANPDYLLSADRMEQLRQDTQAAANPFGTALQGIGRMFGFEGPADFTQLFEGLKEFFQNLFSGNGGGFSMASISNMFGGGQAGNGGGNMLAGMMEGFTGMLGGGAGAGTGGAPAGPQLATVDPNRTTIQPPPGPGLGQGGGPLPPVAPANA